MANSLAGFLLSSVVSAAVFSFPAKTLYIRVQVMHYAWADYTWLRLGFYSAIVHVRCRKKNSTSIFELE